MPRSWFRFSLARAFGSVAYLCVAVWMAVESLAIQDSRHFLWYAWLAGGFLGAGVGNLAGYAAARNAAAGFIVGGCMTFAGLFGWIMLLG